LGTVPDILLPTTSSANPDAQLQNFIQASLTPFINDLSKLYRRENRYHSFVHALDVLQAVYCFLEKEGRVAPIREMQFVEEEGVWRNTRVAPISNRLPIWGEWSGLDLLGDRDLFLLALAAIGHDVGHPGNSNAFLVRCFYPCYTV
jgi:hypothetical protein